MLFVVPNFQGIAPRYADRLLDDSQASFCTNLKIGNGDLRGFRSLVGVTTLTPPQVYRRAIKIYKSGTDEFTWFKSTDVNAAALKSPLAQDAFDRVYFTQAGSSSVRVTTYDDLVASVPSDPSGVARPSGPPTVTPAAGTDDIRAYVYAFVDKYGAIGGPSDAAIATGLSTGTWTISNFGSRPPNAVQIFIYRSAPGNLTAGNFYRIGVIPVATNTFDDAMASAQVPLQPPLDSFNNDPAPNNIMGLIEHSSGAFAAFWDRTVYFSEPYLPSAWPQGYAYPMDDVVVGIAPLLNSVVVLTKSVPMILSGNHPAQMAVVKLPDIEPCTSHRSIVVMSSSVIFASPNGICSVTSNGLARQTNPLLTKDEFKKYQPANIIAAAYGSYYIAFYDTSNGFAVALPPFEPVSFAPLDRYSGITGLDTDVRNGEMNVLQSDRVSAFDAREDVRFQTTWRSKEYISLYPVNLGALQILFKANADEEAFQQLLEAMEGYNTSRVALGPLDMLNYYPIGGAAITPEPIPALSGMPPIQPLGGEPLYDVQNLSSAATVKFTLIADNKVRYSKIITNEDVHSLPERYKATRFYLEVSGSAQVQRIIVAETRRECASA